jgi:GNAT superfamily N-acetyltransferase
VIPAHVPRDLPQHGTTLSRSHLRVKTGTIDPVSLEIVPYERRHLDAVIALCREAEVFEGFSSDPERAGRALAAPGAVAVVALCDAEPVGFAHAISDGAFQAFLSLLLVRPEARRNGIGRRLVAEVIARSGAARVDLLAYEEAEALYATFPHERFSGVSGFRIRPEKRGE